MPALLRAPSAHVQSCAPSPLHLYSHHPASAASYSKSFLSSAQHSIASPLLAICARVKCSIPIAHSPHLAIQAAAVHTRAPQALSSPTPSTPLTPNTFTTKPTSPFHSEHSSPASAFLNSFLQPSRQIHSPALPNNPISQSRAQHRSQSSLPAHTTALRSSFTQYLVLTTQSCCVLHTSSLRSRDTPHTITKQTTHQRAPIQPPQPY